MGTSREKRESSRGSAREFAASVKQRSFPLVWQPEALSLHHEVRSAPYCGSVSCPTSAVTVDPPAGRPPQRPEPLQRREVLPTQVQKRAGLVWEREARPAPPCPQLRWSWEPLRPSRGARGWRRLRKRRWRISQKLWTT